MGKIAGSNPTEGRFLSRIEIFSWILFEISIEIKKTLDEIQTSEVVKFTYVVHHVL